MKMDPSDVVRAIDAMQILLDNATDAQASLVPPQVHRRLLGDGSVILAGMRFYHAGRLIRARYTIYDNDQYAPEKNPDVWKVLSYRDGFRVIDEENPITAEDPVILGERCWVEGGLYESIFDGANVWTPSEYPAGWKYIKEDKSV